MNQPFYTQYQLKVFAEDLHEAYVRSGFEVVEEPHVDYALSGFRATYVRRYLMHKPTPYYDGILTSLIHVIGLPFGSHGQKMVVLSAPRNINNDPISETLKLRIQFDNDCNSYVVHGNQPQTSSSSANSSTSNKSSFGLLREEFNCNQSNQQQTTSVSSSFSAQEENRRTLHEQFINDLSSYIAHIIETISPGLIQLPTEMKLEILKKLSVESIIRMSQVNNEFRSLIFQHGESLWRHLCLRDFNIKIINRFVHSSWMELYRDSYIIQQTEICYKERALPGLPDRPALPPVPYRLQIEWLPELLELPFYQGHEVADQPNNQQLQLALELFPLRRADSLDSIANG